MIYTGQRMINLSWNFMVPSYYFKIIIFNLISELNNMMLNHATALFTVPLIVCIYLENEFSTLDSFTNISYKNTKVRRMKLIPRKFSAGLWCWWRPTLRCQQHLCEPGTLSHHQRKFLTKFKFYLGPHLGSSYHAMAKNSSELKDSISNMSIYVNGR